MPEPARYRLVPEDLMQAMRNIIGNWECDKLAGHDDLWAWLLAVAPDPLADDALVEQVALALYEAVASNPDGWKYLATFQIERYLHQARAVLALMRGR